MAYPNCTINDASYGTFLANEAITLYQRLKFITGSSGDGKPSLAVCGVTEKGDCIAMQPIASGDYGTVRFLNAPGEQFGQSIGTIALGGDVYTDVTGFFSGASHDSNVLIGRCTSAGADGGPFTWITRPATATG
jgi:hypothetical protein